MSVFTVMGPTTKSNHIGGSACVCIHCYGCRQPRVIIMVAAPVSVFTVMGPTTKSNHIGGSACVCIHCYGSDNQE